MTDSAQSEERYPLLFLFLDDGNKAARKNKGVFFERSRSQGIMSGATAVLTQWPGHLSSCGLVVVVSIMTIFIFFLMLVASSIKPIPATLHPRCEKRSFDDLDTSLFLVHDDIHWQQEELDTLEDILMKYQQCDIELLILREDNKTKEESREIAQHLIRPPIKKHVQKAIHATAKNKTEDKLDLNINIGAKSLLKAFLERRRHLNMTSPNLLATTTPIPRIPTIHDLLIKFPRMNVRNLTKTEFFENGPLYNNWRNFNKITLNFAARILKLWEHGGISFEIPRHNHTNYSNNTDYYKYDVVGNNSTSKKETSVKHLSTTVSPLDEHKLLNNMIDIGYISFLNLPEGLVTVDEEGIHMETKTTCHAFFGEALVQLRQANNDTTVPEVIRNTLKTFCVRGAVDSEYCNSVRSK